MQTRNIISPADRLGMTLVLAAALHVIIILGVSFSLEDDMNPENPRTTLDFTIIHTQSDQENLDAEFLAQSNQVGGGTEEESVLPKNPNYNPLNLPEYGADIESQNESIPETQASPHVNDALTVNKSPIKLTLIPFENLITEELHGLAQEFDRIKMELDSTNAEINRMQSRLSQKKREKYASANTREHVTATYAVTIRDRIERVGMLNYPDEARRRNLSGSVYIDIVIRPDGSVAEIYIVRSSGYQVLDDAAMRIADFASPFPPFPETMKETTSIYHFDQVWVFEDGKIFSGQH